MPYKEHSESDLIFQYDFMDAWDRPIQSIQVFDDCDHTIVFGQWTDNIIYKLYSSTVPETVTVSRSAMEQLKAVISNDRIYDNEDSYLHSPDNILDGYTYNFCFHDGVRAAEFHGFNIYACLSSPDKYPFTIFIIETLQKIRDILVPEGVTRECFSLTR